MSLTVTGTMSACQLISEDDYYFSIREFFFMQFKLHLIGRTVENQAGTVDRNSNASNSTRSLFDFFVRFLRSIWGGCPTRRGVSHETEANHANCALSSTGSWTRSINLEKQGHRSGRSARPDGPYHRVDRPRHLKETQGRRKPSFSSLVASQTTRAPTR